MTANLVHPCSRYRYVPAVLLSLTGLLSDPSKLLFIYYEPSYRLAIHNAFTRDDERMIIFGYYTEACVVEDTQ